MRATVFIWFCVGLWVKNVLSAKLRVQLAANWSLEQPSEWFFLKCEYQVWACWIPISISGLPNRDWVGIMQLRFATHWTSCCSFGRQAKSKSKKDKSAGASKKLPQVGKPKANRSSETFDAKFCQKLFNSFLTWPLERMDWHPDYPKLSQTFLIAMSQEEVFWSKIDTTTTGGAESRKPFWCRCGCAHWTSEGRLQGVHFW